MHRRVGSWPTPGEAPSTFRLPLAGNSESMLRRPQLDEIKAHFEQTHDTIEMHSEVAVLNGVEGAGKKSIVNWFVLREANYDCRVWLDYNDDPQAFQRQLKDFKATFQFELSKEARVQNWLIVFINVFEGAAIENFIPRVGCHVIVTTTNRQFRFKLCDPFKINLPPLSQAQVEALVELHTRRAESRVELHTGRPESRGRLAGDLIATLGGMPLETVNAARYGIPIGTYLKEYRAEPKLFLREERFRDVKKDIAKLTSSQRDIPINKPKTQREESLHFLLNVAAGGIQQLPMELAPHLHVHDQPLVAYLHNRWLLTLDDAAYTVTFNPVLLDHLAPLVRMAHRSRLLRALGTLYDEDGRLSSLAFRDGRLIPSISDTLVGLVQRMLRQLSTSRESSAEAAEVRTRFARLMARTACHLASTAAATAREWFQHAIDMLRRAKEHGAVIEVLCLWALHHWHVPNEARTRLAEAQALVTSRRQHDDAVSVYLLRGALEAGAACTEAAMQDAESMIETGLGLATAAHRTKDIKAFYKVLTASDLNPSLRRKVAERAYTLYSALLEYRSARSKVPEVANVLRAFNENPKALQLLRDTRARLLRLPDPRDVGLTRTIEMHLWQLGDGDALRRRTVGTRGVLPVA